MWYNKLKKPVAQVTLELSIAIMAVLIFIVGVARIFAWFNLRFVERQEAYEATRIQADGGPPDIDFYLIDDSRKLHVFAEEED